jgi:hypothetical protein
MRLVRVEARTVEALPRFYVTFKFVERVVGEQWRDVSEEIAEIDGEFEARLIYWRLGRAGEFWKAVGIGISVVGLVAIAWEAGIIAALIEVAGGTKVVLLSIGVSELIYISRVVFGNAKLTLRGFLEAALDGYLMALGFRGAGILGRAVARTIGTESLKRIVGGWVVERLIVGTVGGAGTAAMTTFSHDLINIATGRGGWSSIGDYVNKMAWGALLGTVFEFGVGALQPILRVGGESALQTLKQVVDRVRVQGFTAVRWTALTTEALGNLHARLNALIGDVAAQGFARAMGERLAQVVEQLGGQYRLAVFRRVLELSPGAMSRPAVEGLEKFLGASRADLSNEAALSLLNQLSPNQLRNFLETLNGLEQSSTRRFLNSLSKSSPSQAQEQIRVLLESGPSRESLASFLELVWSNRKQIINEGSSEAVYRLYSHASEANPLTRSSVEYLNEISGIVAGRPQGAVSNIQGSAVRGFHRFERAGANLSAIQERIYLNVKADHAPEVMDFVVRDIVDNPGQFPGIGMAKLTGPGSISGRADAIVIYAENQAAVQNALRRIRNYHAAHLGHFQTTTPPMTNRVVDGVSVGAEPLGVGGQASFGSVRSDIIYNALEQAVSKNLTRQQFRELALRLFQRRGINPEAPHLNLRTGGSP